MLAGALMLAHLTVFSANRNRTSSPGHRRGFAILAFSVGRAAERVGQRQSAFRAHSKTLLIIVNQYLILAMGFSIVPGATFPAMNGRLF